MVWFTKFVSNLINLCFTDRSLTLHMNDHWSFKKSFLNTSEKPVHQTARVLLVPVGGDLWCAARWTARKTPLYSRLRIRRQNGCPHGEEPLGHVRPHPRPHHPTDHIRHPLRPLYQVLNKLLLKFSKELIKIMTEIREFISIEVRV